MSIPPNSYSVDLDTKWLTSILETNDEYGKVMRMSVELESTLLCLIRKLNFSADSNRNPEDLALGQKIHVLEKNQFPANLVLGMKVFNQIRKRFAHDKWQTLHEYKNLLDDLLSSKKYQFTPEPLSKFSVKLFESENKTIEELNLGDRLAVFVSSISAIMLLIIDNPETYWAGVSAEGR